MDPNDVGETGLLHASTATMDLAFTGWDAESIGRGDNMPTVCLTWNEPCEASTHRRPPL